MCEHKSDTRSKVEKLIDAMERLSAALERQEVSRYQHSSGGTSQWPPPQWDKR